VQPAGAAIADRRSPLRPARTGDFPQKLCVRVGLWGKLGNLLAKVGGCG
jgi:hypothetical protein